MDEPTVRHVARLARLKLTEAEVARFSADFAAITGYVEQLSGVDVSGVEPTIHPVSDRNLWREDAKAESLTREQASANAPASEQHFFKVPPVIE